MATPPIPYHDNCRAGPAWGTRETSLPDTRAVNDAAMRACRSYTHPSLASPPLPIHSPAHPPRSLHSPTSTRCDMYTRTPATCGGDRRNPDRARCDLRVLRVTTIGRDRATTPEPCRNASAQSNWPQVVQTTGQPKQYVNVVASLVRSLTSDNCIYASKLCAYARIGPIAGASSGVQRTLVHVSTGASKGGRAVRPERARLRTATEPLSMCNGHVQPITGVYGRLRALDVAVTLFGRVRMSVVVTVVICCLRCCPSANVLRTREEPIRAYISFYQLCTRREKT